MQLDFWFDPLCPFTWNTSRWALNAAGERDLQVNWRPFSLATKNGDAIPERFRAKARFSHGLVRVTAALIEAGLATDVDAAYSEWGRRVHHEHQLPFAIADSLRAIGIDPSFVSAADDPRWDGAIDVSMAEALAVGGDDVGVPIIAWDSDAGRVGFFGPVVSTVPEGDDAARLWDLVVAAGACPELAELKRRRPDLVIG